MALINEAAEAVTNKQIDYKVDELAEMLKHDKELLSQVTHFKVSNGPPAFEIYTRIPANMNQIIEREVRVRGMARADVIREAIEVYAEYLEVKREE